MTYKELLVKIAKLPTDLLDKEVMLLCTANNKGALNEAYSLSIDDLAEDDSDALCILVSED